jgi:predicted nucleic acid-binding protein
MSCVVDTNVLLRFLLRNDPAYTSIRAAVRIIKSKREPIFTTPQNIIELWSACTRPATSRGGIGLTIEAAEHRVRLLERHFPVLPDTAQIYSEWKNLVFTYKVLGVSVHDARIAAAIKIHGISHLLTMNVGDFNRYTHFAVVTPDDVLNGNYP